MAIKKVLKKGMLDFKERTMKKIGQYAISLILKDADAGMMQNDTSGHQYSEQYAKYKANSMRRLTKNKVKKDKKTKKKYIGRTEGVVVSQTIEGRYKQTKGTKKIAGFKSKSTDTFTGYVNLNLTGEMLDSLKVKEATLNRVTIGYSPEQGGKVLGNKKLGYDVTTLRRENVAKVTRYVTDIITNRIKGKYETE